MHPTRHEDCAGSQHTDTAVPVWVLLSGGIDSAACVALYKSQNCAVTGIHIDYGQPAALYEERAARLIASHYGVPLYTLTWSGLRAKGPGEILGRNVFLLSAAVMEIDTPCAIIAMGLHAGTPYYDCSEHFLALVQRMYDAYSNGRIQVAAPFVQWTKQQLWQYEVAPVSRTVRMLKVIGRGNVSWWFRVPVPLLCCSGWEGGFTSDESRGLHGPRHGIGPRRRRTARACGPPPRVRVGCRDCGTCGSSTVPWQG